MGNILEDVLADMFKPADLVWLGRQKWMTLVPMTITRGGTPLPATETRMDFAALERAEGYAGHREVVDSIRSLNRRGDWAPVTMLEMFGTLMADGPKIFHPADEQWEAMEQVELNIPITDFRSPYPAMAVIIPGACRVRLAAKYRLDAKMVPKKVFVRSRHHDGEAPSVTAFMGQIDSNHTVFYQFIQHELNPTIEAALARDANKECFRTPDGYPTLREPGPVVDGTQARPDLFGFGHEATRAALNLCMMLTHFGCKLKAPEGTPGAQRPKNRAERRAAELHGKSWQAIELSQHIVVRSHQRPSGLNATGFGVGTARKPGWIKGHWCAYPGRAEARARGEQVPLYFRRPHWINLHLVEGDTSLATATYEGKK